MGGTNVTHVFEGVLRGADRLRGFAGLVVQRFGRHKGPQNAAALTYTTLLSLVPLMAVILAVFSAFPVADRVYSLIQDWVFQNFVPTSSELLQRHLTEFSAKASQLTGTGAAFLVVVALLMMACNASKKVRTNRLSSRSSNSTNKLVTKCSSFSCRC